MRRTFVLTVSVLALAGCSSSSKPAASTPAGTTGTTASAPAAAPASHPGLGASQTLKFAGGTATMTVLKVVDPVTPKNGSEPAGIRDVAVQVRIVGDGPAAFTSGLMSTLHGFDANGQAIDVHAEWPTSAGPELDVVTGVSVAAGDTQSGFITFEVPTGAKLARLQYTPPGGPMVEWALR